MKDLQQGEKMHFLQQWWRLQSVTKRDGSPVTRSNYIYHHQPICYGFHISYYSINEFCFHFSYFEEHDNIKTLAEWDWRTSLVQNIEDKDDLLVVTTRNSIYTFEKTDENPFSYFENNLAA